MTEAVDIAEYDHRTVTSPAPPARIRTRIESALKGRLEVSWLADDQLLVRSNSHVGVVELPGGPRITVRPKLAGGNLNVLRMFALTSGLPPAPLAELMRQIDTRGEGDLEELIYGLLCSEAAAVLAYGARRDYRAHRADLPAVRGRIQVRRQALHHFGRVEVIACEYQEFDHDVPDNRLLRGAVDLVRRMTARRDTRRWAARLSDELAELAPGPVPAAADFRRTRVYDRQNDHYRIAHHWALVLLENQSLDDVLRSEGAGVRAFLIDMNRLYEDFLAWLISKAFDSSAVSVRPQSRSRSLIQVGGRPYKTVVPDLLIEHQGGRLAVDAKYKMYEERTIAPADVYQLLVYAQGFRGLGTVPRSVLVFPTESRGQEFRIDLVPGGERAASVMCIGIPLPQLVAAIGSDRSLDSEVVQAQLRRLAVALEIPLPEAAAGLMIEEGS